MHPHFLAIPFPTSIRSRLASFCYGLPHVQWTEEENFYLIVRYFGFLSDSNILELHERLASLFFLPFSFMLQGIGHSHSKGNRGVIWVGIKENLSLIALKKEIDYQLKDLCLPGDERVNPSLVLGRYERLSPQKLGDYLSAHADYQSEPIEVTSCLLIRSQQTSKRTFYQIIEHYTASSPATGND